MEINLIKKQVIRIKAKRRLKRLIKAISIIVLAIFLFSSSSVLGFFYFLKQESSDLEEKISQQESQLKSLQEKEAQLVFLNKKINFLAEILKSQGFQQKQAEAVFSLIPEGVSISGFNLLEGQAIELAGKTFNLDSLENFLVNIKEAQEGVAGDLVLTGAYIDNVEQDKEGNYSFKITVTFNEKRKPIES